MTTVLYFMLLFNTGVISALFTLYRCFILVGIILWSNVMFLLLLTVLFLPQSPSGGSVRSSGGSSPPASTSATSLEHQNNFSLAFSASGSFVTNSIRKFYYYINSARRRQETYFLSFVFWSIRKSKNHYKQTRYLQKLFIWIYDFGKHKSICIYPLLQAVHYSQRPSCAQG